MTSLTQIPDKVLYDAFHEEERREWARRRLLKFTRYTHLEYLVFPFNVMLCEYLDAFARGEIKRLIITAPPQHGKTELVSLRLSAYLMGKFPGCKVMSCSYNQTKSNGNSRKARSIVRSPEYNELFPDATLSDERKAMDEWELGNGSSYLARGVGGGISGYGFNFGILDDLIRNRKDAESLTIRESIWDWFLSDFWTRKAKDAGIVHITTRWHEDDPAGRMIKEQPDEGWVVLNFTALAHKKDEIIEGSDPPVSLGRMPGKALCPDLHPKEELEATKKVVGSYVWSSEYDGKPRSKKSKKIHRHWFEIVDRAPEDLKWYRFWDLAVSEEESADRTAGIAMARDADGYYYLRDLVADYWEWPVAKKVIFTSCRIDGPKVMVGVEQSGQQKGFIREMQTDEKFAKYAIRGYTVDGGKLIRALPWIARAEARKIRLVRGRWNSKFLDVCSDFTGVGDKEDDEIDAVSGAYHMVHNAWSPRIGVV